ncbi:unnamed protein product [Euphydryas editha]|uniref:Rhodopsin n=1 Tax=Euphydryas editha TaxID=104508 RepID=A0AAU9UUH9_EUPED|nr:unnamed protein product [Euphydryas editha]
MLLVPKRSKVETLELVRKLQPSSQGRGQFGGHERGPFGGHNPMNPGYQDSTHPGPGPGQGYQGPPVANVSPPPYGQPGHGMPGQNYPPGYQGYPQNYPGQGYHPGQGYPQPSYSPQGYPGHGFGPQTYPGHGYPGQGQPAPRVGEMATCAACTACLTCLFCSCCQGLMGAAMGQGMHEGEDEGPAGTANVSPPAHQDDFHD